MTTFLEKIHALITRSKMAATTHLGDRYYLVTGCAQGSLGFATAQQLLQQGATVSITVRKDSQHIVALLKQQLGCDVNEKIFGFDLDLAQKSSVQGFIEAYQLTQMPLDVLINNAGIHLDLMSKWVQPQLSDDGFEIQWRVNYLGTAQLTLGLLPLLQEAAEKSKDSRIVNVVSQLHSKGLNSEFLCPERPYNSWHAYGQSKLGLVHLTHSLQRYYASKGISSYCLHPGAVYTNVASKGLADTGIIERIRNALAPLEKLLLKTAQQGAQTQLHCATADLAKLTAGAYYKNLAVTKASNESQDTACAEHLWQQLQRWV